MQTDLYIGIHGIFDKKVVAKQV